MESWSSLVEEHALTDSYTLTREDARRIVEEELESAINAYLRANTTIPIMMVITPPERCVAQHVAMIEVPLSISYDSTDIISIVPKANIHPKVVQQRLRHPRTCGAKPQ